MCDRQLQLIEHTTYDTAENEPCKVCPLSAYRSPRYIEPFRRPRWWYVCSEVWEPYNGKQVLPPVGLKMNYGVHAPDSMLASGCLSIGFSPSTTRSAWNSQTTLLRCRKNIGYSWSILKIINVAPLNMSILRLTVGWLVMVTLGSRSMSTDIWWSMVTVHGHSLPPPTDPLCVVDCTRGKELAF